MQYIRNAVRTVTYLGFGKGGAWRARGARAYNGGLGAEPPAGSRGRACGRWVRGAKPPEAETLFPSECLMETANSPIFLKFGNAKDHQTLFNFLQFLLENGKKCIFSYKVACKKFSWSGQRGGPSHRGPPPKYATE